MSTSFSGPERYDDTPDYGAGGWVAFAAVMLFVAGFFDAMWGLAAVLNEEVVTAGGGSGVIVWDFTAWGWAHMVVGGLMIATSLGLFAQRGWARSAGVLFATLSAVLQVGAFTAFPLWAILVIALDVIVIYQLCARWAPER